jgi:hypothetical protein
LAAFSFLTVQSKHKIFHPGFQASDYSCLLFPPFRRRLASNFFAPLGRERCRTRLAAFQAPNRPRATAAELIFGLPPSSPVVVATMEAASWFMSNVLRFLTMFYNA